MTRNRQGGVGTQAKALEVNAFAEIGTGFLLLAMLLTPRRSLILCAHRPEPDAHRPEPDEIS